MSGARRPDARRLLSVRRLRPSQTGFRTLRDVLSWCAGVAIIVHEVWISDEAELYPLLAGAALAGLPLLLPGGPDPGSTEHTVSGTHAIPDHQDQGVAD